MKFDWLNIFPEPIKLCVTSCIRCVWHDYENGLLILFYLGAPKRAAWDYKGRMEDMEEYLTKMKNIQQENIQRIDILELQKNQLQGNVDIKEKEKEEVCDSVFKFW